MANRTKRLFDVEQLPPKPRKPREWRMHMIDAGDCGGCEWPQADCVFECRRCGHRSDWVRCANKAEVIRGLPCPKCNQKK